MNLVKMRPEHGLQVRHTLGRIDGAMNVSPPSSDLPGLLRAFNTFEAEAVLPYFHEPSLLMDRKERCCTDAQCPRNQSDGHCLASRRGSAGLKRASGVSNP